MSDILNASLFIIFYYIYFSISFQYQWAIHLAHIDINHAKNAYIQAFMHRDRTYIIPHLPVPPAVDLNIKRKMCEWDNAIAYLTELKSQLIQIQHNTYLVKPDYNTDN